MDLKPLDRRHEARIPCSRSIWWRGPADSLFQQGWLVDESEKGLAFLARSEDLPRLGECVRTASVQEDSDAPAPRGVVRRIKPIQSGVTLIAIELFPASEAVIRVEAVAKQAA